jgi:hypothetical protein
MPSRRPYTTLRERAKWLSALVKPRDWQLQHQRSANRVLETAASLGGALIKAYQSCWFHYGSITLPLRFLLIF